MFQVISIMSQNELSLLFSLKLITSDLEFLYDRQIRSYVGTCCVAQGSLEFLDDRPESEQGSRRWEVYYSRVYICPSVRGSCFFPIAKTIESYTPVTKVLEQLQNSSGGNSASEFHFRTLLFKALIMFG